MFSRQCRLTSTCYQLPQTKLLEGLRGICFIINFLNVTQKSQTSHNLQTSNSACDLCDASGCEAWVAWISATACEVSLTVHQRFVFEARSRNCRGTAGLQSWASRTDFVTGLHGALPFKKIAIGFVGLPSETWKNTSGCCCGLFRGTEVFQLEVVCSCVQVVEFFEFGSSWNARFSGYDATNL